MLLEAMGAGMAVVSTPMGAIPDIVEQNKNGYLVESQNPHDFFDKIRSLLDDRELMQKFQIRNQEEARSKYRAGAVTRKIESFYHEMIEDKVSNLRD